VVCCVELSLIWGFDCCSVVGIWLFDSYCSDSYYRDLVGGDSCLI